MTPLLAILSALLAGGADFVGGVTSRRVAAVRVAALAQLAGMAIAVPAALLVPAEHVRISDLLYGAASGVVVGVGLALFYTAMARGLISLVVPVAAATGAVVPVVYAFARGERPGPLALAGIVLAVAAIALVSAAPGGIHRQGGIGLALGAGLLFGMFFVLFSLPGDEAGLWPVPAYRAASSVALVALALATTRGIRVPGNERLPVVAIGLLEVTAATALLLALRSGPVAVAAVLASLYPVTTTFLASALLRERLGTLQRVGVALALLAVLLVSAG